MKNFIKQYRNAKKAVAQIKNGEWKPKFNDLCEEHLSAHRGNLSLWIGNGAWFCEINNENYFGLFWRHYVWWFAARKLKNDTEKIRKIKIVKTL